MTTTDVAGWFFIALGVSLVALSVFWAAWAVRECGRTWLAGFREFEAEIERRNADLRARNARGCRQTPPEGGQ